MLTCLSFFMISLHLLIIELSRTNCSRMPNTTDISCCIAGWRHIFYLQLARSRARSCSSQSLYAIAPRSSSQTYSGPCLCSCKSSNCINWSCSMWSDDAPRIVYCPVANFACLSNLVIWRKRERFFILVFLFGI